MIILDWLLKLVYRKLNFYINVNVTKFNNSSKLNPVNSYNNAELLKNKIFKDNNNKSGIYLWINNLNGNKYVGSSENLRKRIRSYFNKNELIKGNRPITSALLKYGHNNFTLEIIEYCSKTELLNREQFYIDLLVPEYNVLKHAYSLAGYRHSKETLEKLRHKIVTVEHKKILSNTHKGKIVSDITREKLSISITKYRKNNHLRSETLSIIKDKTILREGVAVSVVNIKTKDMKTFTNQTEAGKMLGVSRQAIYNAIKRGSLIHGIYIIRKL